jgi:pimeloyl-ACP methyl ester carboxylesterase
VRIVALHGVPTSPRLWERLPIPVVAPALHGVATAGRASWSLDSFVADLLPILTPETVLVGHDLGGVVAAMAALRVRVREVILTGTALGPYWAMVRATAIPPLDRYFYRRYGGRRFLAGSVSGGRVAEVLTAFPGAPDLPERMRILARHMRPPPDLARELGRRVPVRLVWGRRDRWYPPVVARALARATGAEIRWIEAGHLAMWEEPEAFAAALA